ncbi:MAG: MerR family transcriptional regulator [Acidobacteriota bacterium]
MTIGELSRKTGLARSAIRYYEAERLIPAPARRSGRRVFDGSALEQIAVVQLARDAGFSLGEIRRLVNEFGRNRWRALAERKLADVRDASRRLRVMAGLLERLIECRCPDVRFCGRTIRHRCAETAPVPGKTRSNGRARSSASGSGHPSPRA